MAGKHNPSRRALLGAAFALPFVGHANARSAAATSPLHHASHGPPPRLGEDRAWRLAAVALEQAEAALREVERRSAGASHAEQLALEEPFGDRLDELYAAIRRLMGVPAPDVAALAAKICLAVDHEIVELRGGAACMAALKRDALRLAEIGR